MQPGKKHPASKPIFVPVLTRPSGDRYVAFALYQVLQELKDHGFDVAPAPVEAYDAQGKLKPLDVIDHEIDHLVANASLSVPHHAVVFYTGADVVHHLTPLDARKFATTHLDPQELLFELKGNAHDEKIWNNHSLRQGLGLDMLACPAHAAADIAPEIIDDPNVFWMFGVSAQRAKTDADLSHDAVFSTAHEKPIFVISMPTPDAATDNEMLDLLVRLIHHEESLGDREIILIDNPRSGRFKNDLLDRLGKDYKIVTEMGAFTARVLPAVKRHPQSKIFLPGDSASILTESIETLPWHHIIVNAVVIKDDEQRKLVPFFFDHGRIQILNDENKIVKPHAPSDKETHAAYDVARAAIEKFVGDTHSKFTLPAFMPRRA